MPPNTAAPAAASSSAWSFNLRTSKIRRADRDLDDSGSDSDPSSDSEVDESHMLDDLDISTRDETVVYKPNPFSIAKINAAARSTNRLPSTNEPSRPIKPTKAGKRPGGSIVDGLKKQSEKAKSKFQRPPPRANATPSTVRSLSKTQQERAPTPISVPKPPIHSEDTHICGDLAPSASEAASICYAPPSPLRSSHVQAAETCIPRPFDPPALSLPETCPIDAVVVHASFSHLQDIPDAPMRAPDSIHARPRPHAFQTQRPLASYFSSPVSRPEISVSPTNNVSLSSPMRTVARPIQPIHRSQPQSFFAHQQNILQSTPATRCRTQVSPILRPTMPLAATAGDYQTFFMSSALTSALKYLNHFARPRLTATVEMRTGAFSLPGISAPGKKSGMSATSSKRVITFLPPPLASTSDNTPVYQQRQQTQERPKSQNPYPSPTHSTLSSLIPVCADVTNREHRASDETAFSSPYRPLSPPASDLLTVVEPPSERNPSVSIDVDGVAPRYHATRMAIRQRKMLSAQARDMLNLESCGIVHRDEESGDEIAIPLWTGC
ncbi:hypothetical protein ARMGADRAFT_1161253 [Armillaria gallica]|uniref:Uncharacterized protein n=1 Tax=Armillaria gallica TaxID=47427 RepID=A0A2H3DZX7_ARMGA|nr:hypothetical protein ARMGADRAFT_1161253 [Armillaria gallica]